MRPNPTFLARLSFDPRYVDSYIDDCLEATPIELQLAGLLHTYGIDKAPASESEIAPLYLHLARALVKDFDHIAGLILDSKTAPTTTE